MNANPFALRQKALKLFEKFYEGRRIEWDAAIWYGEIDELKASFLCGVGFPLKTRIPRLVLLKHRHNHINTSLFER